MTSQRRLAVFAATAALATVAACGGGGSGGGSGTALERAVGSVGDSTVSRTSFAWSDFARLRALGGVSRQRPGGLPDLDHWRWAGLFGLGAGVLATVPVAFADVVNLFTARQALEIGRPPSAVRVDGVDARAARDGLVRLGGRRGAVAGHDGVVFGADNVINANSRLSQMGVDGVNKASVDGDRIVLGAAESPVADALGGGTTLRGDRPYGDAASCLGHVIAAVLMPRGAAGMPAQVPAGVQVVGIGIGNPTRGSDPAREALCLAVGDRASGDALERQVRAHATLSATSQRTHQPMSALLSSITVSRPGDRVVRVDLIDRPARRAGQLIQMLLNRDLTSLTGS